MDLSKTLRNMIVAFLVSVCSAFFGYVLRIYLARNYNVAEYGLVYAMISFFSFFLIFIDLGMSQAIVKRTSEFRVKKNTKAIKDLFFTMLCIQFVFTATISIIFYLLSGYISVHFFHFDNAVFFRIMILWFLLMPLQFLVSTYLLSYEKTTIYSLIELIKIAFIFLITYTLGRLGFGVSSVFIGYGVIALVVFAGFFIYKPSFFFPFKFSLNFDNFLSTVKYGIFISVGSLAWLIIVFTDTLAITFFRGLYETGLYQTAVPLASTMGIIATPVTTVMFASATNLWAQGKKKELAELFSHVYKYVLAVLLPIALTLILFSDNIITLIFSADYLPAKYPLIILAVGFLFMNMTYVNNTILSGVGLAKKTMKVYIIGGIINLIGNLILVNIFGMIGAAFATFATFLFIYIWLNKYTLDSLKLKFPFEVWLRIGLSSIFFVLPIIILKRVLEMNYVVESIICLIAGGVCYLGALFLLDVLSLKELDFIKITIKKRMMK